MDLTLLNLLDVEFKDFDSVFDSHPELGLNKQLSPLNLDDDPFAWCDTIYGSFDSQTCWSEMKGGPSSQFDLDQSSLDLMFVDPKPVIPSNCSIPSDDITIVEDDCVEWQLKIPEFEPEEECHINTESVSLEHSEFDVYETYTNAQHTELQFDDPQNFENDLQTYTQQQEQVASETELKISDKVYPKPILSYPCLSALALKNSQSGRLLVTQIYGFILTHFPYFRTARKGWKNSVRHNLSHNKTFQKLDATTSGCPNKRSNLWFIDPAKAAKMDEQLRKISTNHFQDIRKSMCHPEQLEMLVSGEMKFDSSMDDDEDDILSEFLIFPSAKRRRTVDGEMETSYVYEPATRRKTSLDYLTMDVFAEE